MLLVYDYHLQIRKRSEDSTSGTDDQADLGPLYLSPLGDALGVRQAGVQDRDIVFEPLEDLEGKLMSQGDLRNKIDYLAALLYDLLGATKENLGLSGPGDTEQIIHHAVRFHDGPDRILLLLGKNNIRSLDGLICIKATKTCVLSASGNHRIQNLATA